MFTSHRCVCVLCFLSEQKCFLVTEPGCAPGGVRHHVAVDPPSGPQVGRPEGGTFGGNIGVGLRAGAAGQTTPPPCGSHLEPEELNRRQTDGKWLRSGPEEEPAGRTDLTESRHVSCCHNNRSAFNPQELEVQRPTARQPLLPPRAGAPRSITHLKTFCVVVLLRSQVKRGHSVPDRCTARVGMRPEMCCQVQRGRTLAGRQRLSSRPQTGTEKTR